MTPIVHSNAVGHSKYSPCDNNSCKNLSAKMFRSTCNLWRLLFLIFETPYIYSTSKYTHMCSTNTCCTLYIPKRNHSIHNTHKHASQYTYAVQNAHIQYCNTIVLATIDSNGNMLMVVFRYASTCTNDCVNKKT